MTAKGKCRFDIDFIEFAFLVEACIPPRPIARAMFWNDVIDKYYHVLTPDERDDLFNWIQRNPLFEESVKTNEDCKMFYDRYNPDNQYMVTTFFDETEDQKECFVHNDAYHVSSKVMVNKQYITKMRKHERTNKSV